MTMLLTFLNASNDIQLFTDREPSLKWPSLRSLVHATRVVVWYIVIAVNWMGVYNWSWVRTKGCMGEDRIVVRIIGST